MGTHERAVWPRQYVCLAEWSESPVRTVYGSFPSLEAAQEWAQKMYEDSLADGGFIDARLLHRVTITTLHQVWQRPPAAWATRSSVLGHE